MKKYVCAILIFLLILFGNMLTVANSIEKNVSCANSYEHGLGLLLGNNHNLPIVTLTGPTPNSFDWRNYNGKDWTTTIKDQGSCNSCYAFAGIACLESVYKIEKNLAYSNIDFSEQLIVSCGSKCGGMLGCYGGDTGDCLEFLKNYGTVYEDYFEYQARGDSDTPEVICHDKSKWWSTSLVKVSNWGTVSFQTESIKNALITYGPLVTSMIVYQDFHNSGDVHYYPNENYWPKNVYYQRFGDRKGEHAVTIVGYADDESVQGGGYWICKNSWGKSWGLTKSGEISNQDNRGWFRIAYGDTDSQINYDTLYVDGVYDASSGEIYSSKDFNWLNVKPGSTITDTFMIENIGTETITSWEVGRYANWGSDWTFNPSSGVNLKPDETVSITVSVKVPKEKDEVFYGSIKIEGSNCINCYKIDADCKTAKPKDTYFDSYYIFKNVLFEKFFLPKLISFLL